MQINQLTKMFHSKEGIMASFVSVLTLKAFIKIFKMTIKIIETVIDGIEKIINIIED